VSAPITAMPAPAGAPKTAPWWYRAYDSDLVASFRRSKLVMLCALTVLVIALAAIFAPLLAPQNSLDPRQLDLLNSHIPPIWSPDGQAPFTLGTDEQGRDVFSAILYGLRISLWAVLGIALGLLAGYFGGALDGLIMRVADVQLTFPAILIALIVDGVVKAIMGGQLDTNVILGVLVFSIGLSFWVQYARTVRGQVLVEKNKDYVAAARLIGLSSPTIMVRHVLPNVLGPVFSIATINFALAIITEATLSFLGSGMPETQPSLGTLIRVGNKYLFSGEYWIVAFPGLALAALVLSINLLGDWLRDALNPKLR
jgi:peptide/nickel transport system permease protein